MAKEVMTKAERKERWFAAGKPTGWRKDEKQSTRIRKVLKSRNGNVLAAARALNALANVNSGPEGDKETARKARADARKLFARYRRKKSK